MFCPHPINAPDENAEVIRDTVSFLLKSGDEARSASVLREREKREREVSISIRSH